MNKRIQDIQQVLRLFIKQIIQPGDFVLDATAGRGRDTLFLAECVGEQGLVYALDIQPEALEHTRELLHKSGAQKNVRLFLLDHGEMSQVVTSKLRVVMFNLGYLPDSDHQVVTKAPSTVRALQAAADLLLPGGVISITVYRGHPGAQEEEKAVSQFLYSLPKKFTVLEGRYPNLSKHTPYWLLIQKKEQGV